MLNLGLTLTPVLLPLSVIGVHLWLYFWKAQRSPQTFRATQHFERCELHMQRVEQNEQRVEQALERIATALEKKGKDGD